MTQRQPEALVGIHNKHHDQDTRLIRDHYQLARTSLLACFHDTTIVHLHLGETASSEGVRS